MKRFVFVLLLLVSMVACAALPANASVARVSGTYPAFWPYPNAGTCSTMRTVTIESYGSTVRCVEVHPGWRLRIVNHSSVRVTLGGQYFPSITVNPHSRVFVRNRIGSYLAAGDHPVMTNLSYREDYIPLDVYVTGYVAPPSTCCG